MIFESVCRHAGIGANSYLLKTDSAKLVLDAGMHPKHEGSEALPHYEFLEPGIAGYPLFEHRELNDIEDGFETRAIERPFDVDPVTARILLWAGGS